MKRLDLYKEIKKDGLIHSFYFDVNIGIILQTTVFKISLFIDFLAVLVNPTANE